MNRVFISIRSSGIARAERGANSGWSVEALLQDRDIRCLAADPHNANVIYAGTQGSGVLRSDDRGRTWHPAGLTGHVVKSVAVSPVEQDVLYAGVKPPMIFVSRDAGNTWRELESFRKMRRWFWLTPAEWPPTQPYVMSLALSPTDPDVIVAGVEFGAVLRSADGGQTWTGHHKGALRDCHSLTFHASDGNWVYEAGGGGAAFSSDGGITWTQPKDGLDRRYGWACAADPEHPEIWYSSVSPLSAFPTFEPAAHVYGKSNAYIFRRRGDAPWERLDGGLPQPLNYMANALLTDPQAPGHLYAGLSSGEVWHSTDYGDHWQQLPLSLGRISHCGMIML
jgi:hypothetical protein